MLIIFLIPPESFESWLEEDYYTEFSFEVYEYSPETPLCKLFGGIYIDFPTEDKLILFAFLEDSSCFLENSDSEFFNDISSEESLYDSN